MPVEPYIGTVMLFSAVRGAPNGWVPCNGQLLAISQYTDLFSLIGKTYGGDGLTTFAVPDLRSRVPIHFGQGAGLTDRIIGEASGTESVALQATHLPSHTHTVAVTSAANTVGVPSNSVTLGVAQLDIYSSQTANVTLHPQTISNVGGNQPHENRQPFMAMNYVMAFEGLFPPRP